VSDRVNKQLHKYVEPSFKAEKMAFNKNLFKYILNVELLIYYKANKRSSKLILNRIRIEGV